MELRHIPEETVREYEALMRRQLARYANLPDFDELCSRARLEVWVELDRIDPSRRANSHGLVRKVTRWAVYRYFVTVLPKESRNLSLDQLEAAAGGLPKGDRWMRLREPDFVPRLLDRLEREATLRAVRLTLSPAAWEEVRGWYRRADEEGDKAEKARRYMRVQRYLNRYREVLGLPLKANGSLGPGAPSRRPPKLSAGELRLRKRARDRERDRRRRAGEKKREKESLQ